MTNSDKITKIGFFVSTVVLAFLYGFAAHGFGLFPNSYLEKAWRQARAVFPVASASSPQWQAARVFEQSGVRTLKPDATSDGYTLVASHWEDLGWRSGLKLLNAEGEVVHRWSIRPDAAVNDSTDHSLQHVSIHGSELLANGDVVINMHRSGVTRLDACSRVRWWRSIKGHHSVARADDSTFWVASRSDSVIDETVANTFGRDNLDETNKVVHLAQDGRILQKISVLGVLQEEGLLRRIFTERHIDHYSGLELTDLTHLNDVEPLSAEMAVEYPLFTPGDLLLSMKYANLVLVMDSDTREVKWRNRSHPVLRQHDPDFIGNGWIGVFDNEQDGSTRGTRLGGSKIVAINPAKDSVATLFVGDSAKAFYSGYGGKWQHLENGNLLLTEMAAGRILEVTDKGEVVWQWIKAPVDQDHVAEVTEGTRYQLSPDQLQSWPCSPSEVRP